MKKFLSFLKKASKNHKGFILPLTLVIVSITLAISTSITTILLKELYFSRISRDSTLAYYAADNGIACAVYVDDAYLDPSTGIGIFPYDSSMDSNTWINQVLVSVNAGRASRGSPEPLTRTNIKCGTSAILDTNAGTSNFMVSATPYSHTKTDGTVESGNTSLFTMHMDLGDGTIRCAQVTVNKTASFRQIIARGFTTCQTTSSAFIERAVINTTTLN